MSGLDVVLRAVAPPPPRARSTIALVEENCTSCMLCARECPCWCIDISSHKEEVPARTPGARPRVTNVLDRFAIDWALCMYCGICVEVCPFDALLWAPSHHYPATEDGGLVHERDRLREWVADVPAPQQHDPAAEPAKELAVARRKEGNAPPPPQR